jgi:DNA-binding beta-propeller fold protein YncE
MKPIIPGSFAKVQLLLFCLSVMIASCKHEPPTLELPEPADRFPTAVGRIIQANCAVAGCHNAASHQFSGGGLLMDTWDHLFEGGNHGAAIVPYSPENSPLLYFINSYPDFGPVPTDPSMKMPLNGNPLSRSDYSVLRDWILDGAPDKFGNVPFASNASTRQKIYVVHQRCDYVTVIDAEKHVIMRSIPVGMAVTIETGYDIKIAADGMAYASLWTSDELFRIDTKTDSVSGRINLGMPNSNVLHLSPNGNELLVANWYMSGLLRVNAAGGVTTNTYNGTGFTSPHGIASNRSFDTFFVTELIGNTIYRIAASGAHEKISIDGTTPTQAPGKPDPYKILMAPDYTKYFVSCAGSNELRVMDAHADTLIKVIPVGKKPQEMAFSRDAATPYLFISCEEDSNANPTYRGSVYIINYKTYEVVEQIRDRYFMPHALAVDDQNGMLYVFSRNIDPSGPAPHHNSSTCEGRSGYYSIYNFKERKPLNNRRYELTVDPHAADVRFK